MSSEPPAQPNRQGHLLKFLLPSLAGAFIFLFPVRDGDIVTIPMAVMTSWLTALLAGSMPYIVLGIIAASAAATVWAFAKRITPEAARGFQRLFAVSTLWLIIRLAGFAMAIMIVFQCRSGL